jgi:hypothetical protein
MTQDQLDRRGALAMMGGVTAVAAGVNATGSAQAESAPI